MALPNRPALLLSHLPGLACQTWVLRHCRNRIRGWEGFVSWYLNFHPPTTPLLFFLRKDGLFTTDFLKVPCLMVKLEPSLSVTSVGLVED